MSLRDSLNKAKEAIKSAKDTVVDFVSEEIVDTGPGSGSEEKKKRKLKQWVVVTGTACVSIAAAVAARGSGDSTASGAVGNSWSKDSSKALPCQSKGYNHPKGKVENHRAINSKDTSLDNLIRASSKIESILEDKGGSGRGLHEKASSVKCIVSEKSVDSIRFIASIRNKLVHEGPDTVTSEMKRNYLNACIRVLRDFKSSK
jgi:hypothetical protein